MFTTASTEQEVREFLQQRFSYIDEESARAFREHSGYLRTRRKGRTRSDEASDIREWVVQRDDGTTIGEQIDRMLSDTEKDKHDQTRRLYYREYKRAHPLLDVSRSYNETDFVECILAKQFAVAAAIFKATDDTSKTKINILAMLNKYY